MKRFISVYVYRNTLGDATNNGVTHRVDKCYVPHTHGNIEECDLSEHDVVLEPKYIGSHLCFKPAKVPQGTHTMAGGNFVYTSDSRFSSTYQNSPVSVHDRIE